jgi:hypothetical protein
MGTKVKTSSFSTCDASTIISKLLGRDMEGMTPGREAVICEWRD